jgi:hypothetical protein
MAKLFGVIPYGRSGGALGEFVKDVGTVGEGFMGRALATKDAEDAREAAIADSVTKATLTAAINLDSKYPAFVDYQEERLDKYKSLANNSAVGPEKAKYFFDTPGFLDRKTWLEDAIAWSLNPQNATFKYTGGVEPEKQIKKNLEKFQNRVRGKFGDSHGGNMSNLFVGEVTEPTTPTTIDSTQTDTTSITTDLTGSTQTDTGAEGDFTTSMMPPRKQEGKTESIDRIWATVIAASKLGKSPETLVKEGVLSKEQLIVWNETSGTMDTRMAAMDMAVASNTSLWTALLGSDENAAYKAFNNIKRMTNMLNLGMENTLLNTTNEEGEKSYKVNNYTYQPVTDPNTGKVGLNPENTKEVIYGIVGNESEQNYVRRNGVFLKINVVDGKVIVEGD